MMRNKGIGLVLAALLLLAACGGQETGEEPTIGIEQPTTDGSDAVATSVQQTIAAIAVAQTVGALTTGQPTAPAATPTTAAAAPLPTVEAALPTTAPAASPPPAAAVCRVIGGVNVRPGPGIVYEPVIAALGDGIELTPLAFVPVGFPQGPWLQVHVPATGDVGWVSALPQFVQCDVDPASLPPPANIPPTPFVAPPTAAPPTAVPPTATRQLASAPPDIDNDAPGGSFPSDNVLGEVIVNPTFLFRMDVRDLTFGSHEGAGTNFAEFSITGNGVDYFRREGTAGYCVFGGGEPTCNPWPTDDQGRYTWGQGGPLVESGEYFASITVNAQRDDPEFGNSWNWNFPFRVTLP
jgi:hypothetical protein